MNGWDLFTYINVAILGGGAVIIFGFFLRDVATVLRGEGEGPEDGPP